MPRGRKKLEVEVLAQPTEDVATALAVIPTEDGLFKVAQFTIDLKTNTIVSSKLGAGDSKNMCLVRAQDYLTIATIEGSHKIVDFH